MERMKEDVVFVTIAAVKNRYYAWINACISVMHCLGSWDPIQPSPDLW